MTAGYGRIARSFRGQTEGAEGRWPVGQEKSTGNTPGINPEKFSDHFCLSKKDHQE
jgi:hypothetical protein